MTMLDLKPRQTSRITSISVNRVSRCGLILPNVRKKIESIYKVNFFSIYCRIIAQ